MAPNYAHACYVYEPGASFTFDDNYNPTAIVRWGGTLTQPTFAQLDAILAANPLPYIYNWPDFRNWFSGYFPFLMMTGYAPNEFQMLSLRVIAYQPYNDGFEDPLCHEQLLIDTFNGFINVAVLAGATPLNSTQISEVNTEILSHGIGWSMDASSFITVIPNWFYALNN